MGLFNSFREWFRVQSVARKKLRRQRRLWKLGIFICDDDDGLATKSDVKNLAKRILFLADLLGYEENNDWLGGFLPVPFRIDAREVRLQKKRKK